MLLTILIIWFVGGFLTFCGEAYFEGELHNNPSALITGCSMWFIILPMMAIERLYLSLANLGKLRRKEKEKREKIRIALAEENEELEAESIKATNEFVQDLKRSKLK